METHTVKCGKCRGTGYIPGFAHVSEGVCFDCRGSGVLVEKQKGTVKFSRAFISEYRQSGYCPELTSNTKKILCFEWEGHATAEKWVMRKNGAYIIGQPICRASGWFVIPAPEMDEFLRHYNKVNKTAIHV